MNPEKLKHAVVIGGSMGGLLAARVLAKHFDLVTIVERDAFPQVGEQRRGVPQGQHTHGLLASGRQVLNKLFPSLMMELVDAGAVPGDIVRDCRWFFEGGCLNRPASGLEGILVSRPLLEGTVRKHLLRLSNVRTMENADVAGLVATEDCKRVTGLRLADGTVLEAGVIVDASGRGSHAPDWLESVGYAKPETERVEIGLAYTTRIFRRLPHQLDGDVAAVIPPTPQGKRGGVMLAQEGSRWTVTLMSHFGPAAPTDLPGFREFARSLPSADIYEVVNSAEPLGDARSARFPASLRRRYEKLDRFPEGFVVFGDAISSFNPIYGQGMSVSALESNVLDECLSAGNTNLAIRFFAKAAKVVDIPWSIAVGNDLRMPETTGPRNAGVNFINWYMSKLHKVGQHDAEVSLAFHRVGNLIAPPPSVMHPKVVLRVVMGSLRQRKTGVRGELSATVAAGSR